MVMKFVYSTLTILLASGMLFAQSTIVSITGSIKNELTKEPIGIDIRLFNTEGKQIGISRSNSKDGYYFITGLKPDSVYYLKFMDFSYFSDSHEFQVPNTKKYAEYSKDFVVKPKQIGLKFPLRVIPFDLGKSKLRPGADIFLKDLLNSMKLNRRVDFKIAAFPDNDGDGQFNQQITTERCEALKKYFIQNGIEETRITIQSNPTTDPDNPPPAKKQAKGKRYLGSIYLEITKI